MKSLELTKMDLLIIKTKLVFWVTFVSLIVIPLLIVAKLLWIVVVRTVQITKQLIALKKGL